MQVNRGLVFWGVALVTAGAVALAVQRDVVGEDVLRNAWRFWPVVLIVIGLAVISARTPFALVATLLAGIVAGGLVGLVVGGIPYGVNVGCSGEVTDRVADDATFDGSAASVELDFNCGDLAVSVADGAGWSVDAGYAGRAEPTIETDGDSLRVESPDGGFMVFADARQDWEVSLPADPELELDVEANAGTSRLELDGGIFSELSVSMNAGEVRVDLGGASADAFSLDANAGSVSLVVDGESTATGSISVNAGSVEMCTGDGATVAITISDPNVTFSHNLDSSDLDRSGDTWSNAEDASVVLDVEGNAASFTLNPNGGC
jgi:hypothetical protein